MYHGRDIFQGDATAYAHDLATVIVTETLTFGIFSLLIVFSTYHLLVNGVKARARQMLLLVTIVMYAGAATHWAARLVSFYLLISQNFYAFNAVFSSAVTQCAPTALLVINIVLSDAIVLSRAWILWSQNRYIQAISTALLLCTLALSAGNSRDICRTFDFGGLPQVQPSATVSDDPIGAAAFSFSLATNLWSTSLSRIKRGCTEGTSRNTFEGGTRVRKRRKFWSCWLSREPSIACSGFTWWDTH
ncbi:hypothetical protein OF83DRAFT_183252 [Amylostereum chailletii]|nr:hypothetical protein OF83DRAFT_183252 [Amylostereum chailletii]